MTTTIVTRASKQSPLTNTELDSNFTNLKTTADAAISSTGNNTLDGNLIVTGDLEIQGTTTSIDSTTVEITDLNITLAKDATNNTQANGAGITIAGSSAELKYVSTGDKWTLNKNLEVSGTIQDSNGTFLPSSSVSTFGGTLIDDADAAAARTTLGLGTAATSATGDFLAISGGMLTGNLSLGDNVKLQLGNQTNGDLQIYHDGSASYIKENGTGDLIIQGSNTMRLQGSSNQELANFSTGGAVTLFNNGSSRLSTTSTGISVDGSVVADGLTVDTGSTFAVSATLGHTGGSQLFFLSDDGGSRNQIDSQKNSASADLDLATGGVKRQKIASNGDISFYNDSAAQGLFFDSSTSSLGLGTTSPSSFVESSRFVVGSGTSGINEMMFLYSGTNAFGAIGFADGTSGTSRYKGTIGYHHASDEMFFSTNGGGEASRDLTISSSGNATFSGSVTSTGLTVNDNTNGLIIFGPSSTRRIGAGADYSGFRFYSDNSHGFYTNNVERLKIGSTGNVNINSSLMIGSTTAPVTALDVLNGGNTYTSGLLLRNGTSTSEATSLYHDNTGSTTTVLANRYGSAASAIKLVLQAASASPVTALTALGNGNVGIGTSSPTVGKLQVNDASGATLAVTRTSASTSGTLGTIRFGNTDIDSNLVNIVAFQDGATNSGAIKFETQATGAATTERMRIDSSGNVGIGSVSASAYGKFLVHGTGNLINANASSGAATFQLYEGGQGRFGITTLDGSAGAKFTTAGTERMRIDSSGNLLVGKTTASSGTAGHKFSPTGAQESTVDGGLVAYFNRLSSDGEIVRFDKANSQVGSIGVNTGNGFYIHSNFGNDSGLVFGSERIVPCTSTGAFDDAVVDLGYSSGRFKDLYLSGHIHMLGNNQINGGTGLNLDSNNTVFRLDNETEIARFVSTGLAIGTSSPSTYDSRANNLVVGDSGDSGITIFSGATSNARLQFAPSGSTGLDNGEINYDNNNDSMSFATGGTNRLTISSSGNVGFNTDPSAWSSVFKAIEIGTGAAVTGRTDSPELRLVSNAYLNTSNNFIYKTSNAATMYTAVSGIHIWSNAPVGTAGNTATMTERLRIDSQGALKIGGNSNSAFVDFDSVSLQLNTQRNPNTGAFVNTAKSHASITLRGDNGGSDIRFGTANANNTVATERIRIDQSGTLTTPSGVDFNIMSASGMTLGSTTSITVFKTNNQEATRIDASQNFLVGKTVTSLATAGIALMSNDQVRVTTASDNPIELNRLNTAGDIARFYQDTVQKGNISVSSFGMGFGGGTRSSDFFIKTDGTASFASGVNLGVGTSPDGIFHVKASSGVQRSRFESNNSHSLVRIIAGTGSNTGLEFYSGTGNVANITVDSLSNILFEPNGSEKARLTSGGQFLINATTPYRDLLVGFTSTDTNTSSSASGFGGNNNVGNGLMINNTSTTNNTYAPLDFKCGTNHVWGRLAYKATDMSDAFGQFEFITMDDGSAVNALTIASSGNGTFAGSCTATSFPTSSDARLKDNIEDAEDSGDIIDKIKVRQFDWKKTGKHQDYGMIAQELLPLVPDAVSGDANSEDYLGIDYSRLVPLLLKEVQNLRKEIKLLKEKE